MDEASDAPLLEESREELLRWAAVVGDPARPYAEGLGARRAVEEARGAVADLVGANPRNVTFCSSATEGLNWLVYSAALSGAALVISRVEHSAVTKPARKLAGELSLVLVEAEVDPAGRVTPESLEAAVSEAVDRAYGGKPSKTSIFCFIQHANHELGTLQPLAELAEVGRRYGARIVADAAQTFGRIPFSMAELGAVAVVASAHKFGGPKGAGAVVTAPGFRPRPLLYGAAQERNRRAGTEDVAAIASFGAASRRVAEDLHSEAARQAELTESFLEDLTASLSGVRVLGDRNHRVPHIVSLELEGVQGEAVVLSLDKRGFAVHSGSACGAEAFEPSPILEAVGADSRRNLRISVGRSTTSEMLEALRVALVEEVQRLRRLADRWEPPGNGGSDAGESPFRT